MSPSGVGVFSSRHSTSRKKAAGPDFAVVFRLSMLELVEHGWPSTRSWS